MTRADLTTRLRNALNDPDGVYWSASELHATLLDAMEVLAEEAPSLKRSFQIPRRPGDMVYTLPGVGSNLMAPYRVWLPDQARRLEAVTLTDLDARHERWMEVTGDPYVWVPIDWRQLLIWPVPTTGGGWLQIDAFVWPDALQDDGDEPEFPPADHEALVLYGEVEGYLKQGDPVRALDLWQQFVTRWGHARSRASVEHMVSRFYVRSDRGSTARGDD